MWTDEWGPVTSAAVVTVASDKGRTEVKA